MKRTTVEAKLIELKSLYETHGPKALIDGCSGLTNYGRFSYLWCAAMTEMYGTPGLHKAWTNEDGSPTAECLEKFPSVRGAIAEAKDRIRGTWTFISSSSPWIKDEIVEY